jgi:hypothetical protein
VVDTTIWTGDESSRLKRWCAFVCVCVCVCVCACVRACVELLVNTVFECVCGWVMYALCRHPLHRPARLPAAETERLEALASLNLGAYTANDR